MAFLILGLALEETRVRHLMIAPLVALGDASYPIYLLHMPLVALTARVARHLPLLDNWFGGLLFSFVCVIAVADAYHRFYERPALSGFRRILGRTAPLPVAR